MKTVRLRSGGFVNVLEDGDSAIPGEINFTGKELAWTRKISASTNDPEAEKEFWRVILEKKVGDPAYSVFQDFPEVEGSGSSPDPTLRKDPSAQAAQSQDTGRRTFVGASICQETIEFLKRGKKDSA